MVRSNPVRILVWQWGRRGAGPLYALNMARALNDQPETAVFVTYSTLNEQLDEFRALGIPHLEVGTFETMAQGLMKSLSLPSIRRELKKFLISNSIDLVYCPMSHPWNAGMVSVLKELDLPLITTVHDAHRHPGDAHLIQDWIHERLEGVEREYACGYVTLSTHIKEQLVQRLRVPPERVAVIPLAAFEYSAGVRTTRSESNSLRILFLGRIQEYKGLDILLAAYNIVSQEFGDRVQLTIAGSGDMTPYTQSLAEVRRVKVVNTWLSDGEISDLLADADVLAIPNRDPNMGPSGIVASAYGAGLPVVVTPVGSLPEQVIDGTTGLVAASISPSDFAAPLARLLTESGLVNELSEGATQHARENLSWRQSAEALLEFAAQFPTR